MSSAIDISDKGDTFTNMNAKIQDLEARISLLGAQALAQSRATPTPVDPSCHPAPIGLIGFAMVAIMAGYQQAGLVEKESASLLTVWGFCMGGILMVIVGIWEQKRGGLFGAWAFTAFGCSWLATGLFNTLVAAGVLTRPGPKGEIAKAALWLIFSVMLTVVGCKVSLFHIPICIAVCGIFFFEILAFHYESAPLMHAAGYSAMAVGSMAFMLAFFMNVNLMWGRQIFNYGSFGHGHGGGHSKPSSEDSQC